MRLRLILLDDATWQGEGDEPFATTATTVEGGEGDLPPADGPRAEGCGCDVRAALACSLLSRRVCCGWGECEGVVSAIVAMLPAYEAVILPSGLPGMPGVLEERSLAAKLRWVLLAAFTGDLGACLGGVSGS